MNYVIKFYNKFTLFIIYLFNIVIQARDNLINKIDEECKELFKEKLKVMNGINQRLGKDNRTSELCENPEKIFKELNVYISFLMRELWE